MRCNRFSTRRVILRAGAAAVALGAMASCGGTAPAGTTRLAAWGEMREVLRDGRTQGRTTVPGAMARVGEGPFRVGVGAAAGLEGEIAVLDGEAWVSTVDAGGVVGTEAIGVVSGEEGGAAGTHATMLLIAGVPEWTSRTLDGPVADLEETVGELATSAGLDATLPVPFMVEGVASRLEGHIINGVCPNMTPRAEIPAEHAPAWIAELEAPTRVTIVGFYYPGEPGVYTHHSSAVHAHTVRIGGRTAVFHIDAVGLLAGAELRLPRGASVMLPR